MQINDVIDALNSSASQRRTPPMPPSQETDDGRIIFRDGLICVILTPVMHNNEIELSLEIGGSLEKFSEDAVQHWLGSSIHAYMFSDNTVMKVANDVVDVVFNIFRRFHEDAEFSIHGLKTADREVSENSERNWLREMAEKAWELRNYKAAVEFYTKLDSSLSKVEEKRLELARRHLAE